MGSCLSKKSSSTSTPVAVSSTNQETKPNTLQVEKKKVEGQIVRKEIFVIKHRISHEGSICSKDSKDNVKKATENANNSNEESGKKNATIIVPAPVRRSSSCTKEDVDAILVQCGRLSRSSSTNKGLSFESCDNTKNHNRSRRYSISKKSYDFDNDNTSAGSRRVSRSPGRRSESPVTASNCANLASADANGSNVRPGTELISTAAIQRIQVKRNVGAASPRARSRSPARVSAKVSNENKNFQQQPLSLSRSNSRKKEDSPFRRNPLSEIGTTVVTEHMPFHNNIHPQKLNAENATNGKVVRQGTEDILSIAKATLDYGLTDVNGKVKELQQLAQEAKALTTVEGSAAVNVVASGFESLVPQGIRRSRSSRLSWDLDINLGVKSNPTQSYTELLLEDIQKFHQKSSNSAFSLPPCVTKACSILDAVADLNSSTSSSLSSAFSDDRRRNPKVEQLNKNTDTSLGTTQGKKRLQIKEPYVESEVALSDHLIKSPIIQKYVTFGRGTDGGYLEEPESSGSNSTVGGQRCWFSPSSRGPNSADSTDSWSPSKSYSRLHVNPLAFQKHTVSEYGHDLDEDKRRITANTRDSDNQQRGIGHNRTPRGPHTISMAAAAASTY